MIHIPIQILSSAAEFSNYIYDCLLSLKRQEGVGNRYRLTVNVASYEPASARVADSLRELNTEFFQVNLIELHRSCGYGEKQNLVWNGYTRLLSLPFDAFLTMNPDMILMPDVIDKLYETFSKSEGRARIVEARQFPIENPPRAFDITSLEVNWCSGACILLSADFFERCRGFDENIFLYCEDVDLSWRAWLDGGQCLYRYDAIAAHMTEGIFEARYNPHSIAASEKHMALSHLILSWKYFSNDKSAFSSAMNIFTEYPSIGRHAKETALAQFELIKPRIQRQTSRHPRIEVLGVGLYSTTRANLI